MADVVNIHEAKTHLSRIVEQVAAGREVIIAKAGRRVAKLVPLEAGARPKKLGGLKGRIKVPMTSMHRSMIASPPPSKDGREQDSPRHAPASVGGQ
jgi:prevent-host-death family protein